MSFKKATLHFETWELEKIDQDLMPVSHLYLKNIISAPEMVSAYLLVALKIQVQERLIVGQWNKNSNEGPKGILKIKEIPGLKLSFNKQNFEEESILSLIGKFRSKFLSTNVQRCLLAWHERRYQLELVRTLPSAKEILTLQATGKRYVSLFSPCDTYPANTGHSDPVDFLIHDLLHADHFFSQPGLFQGQKKFYQYLLQTCEHPLLIKAQNEDPEFKRSFEYLCSDMNSHPVHLLKTLKAILRNYFQKTFDREKTPEAKTLAWEISSRLFSDLFPDVKSDPALYQSFSLINDKNFDLNQDGKILETYFSQP